ncbi:MAG: hypothetical protein CL524_13060 [Aequorivita sp.]|nr:hypothetical protein [Aequorivita sp.]|tara:strand:+ start:581 stop:1348 length:768 start_codon:yes stop_codon:yes gene_type:complete
MQKPLEIANWEEHFEVAQSRRRPKRLSWVPIPTRHDSRGYRKLIRSEGGLEHFGCWCALIQVSAKCSIRGVLADDRGLALTCDDLEAMTDIPASCFESAIPILCDIGWLICPSSYQAPSEVGAQSEDGTSTVHNSTVQTEQNKTTQVHCSQVFNHQRDSTKYFNMLPSNRRRGKASWQKAWVDFVVQDQVDPQKVIDSILEYYKSGEGQSEYFRSPARLLEDCIWQESPESWNAKHAKPIDATSAFEKVFDEQAN